MIRDESEEIANIEWDAYGKIKSITRIGTSTKPDLGFAYMPSGERAIKVEMTKNVDGSVKPSSSWNFTCYMRDATGNVLNTIISSNGPENLTDEFSIYGSSRLGTWSPNIPTTYLDGLDARGEEYRITGDKMYELSNHLGNVMVTISDKKVGYDNNSDGYANAYHADVTSMNDYYAFGMQMPGRTYSSPSYRYGFNGKEKDDETYSVSGGSYDYGFRIYNSRLGRFLSRDPLTKKYAELSPFQYASNSPIWAIDIDGLEGSPYTDAPSPLYQPTCLLKKKSYWETFVDAIDILIESAPDLLTFTDVNDVTVLTTTVTRKGNGININNQPATNADVGVAGVEVLIPGVSGALVKRLADKGWDIAKLQAKAIKTGEKVFSQWAWGKLGMLRWKMIDAGIDLTGKQAHHIIPLELTEDQVVRNAIENGFDMNGLENGIGISTDFHSGSHQNYTEQITDMINEAKERLGDNYMPEQAVTILNDIINKVRPKLEKIDKKINEIVL